MIVAIVPGLNVRNTVGDVVRGAKKYVDEVVFVDDGCKDDSAAVAKNAGATVLKHERNKGKGFALRTGFDYALSRNADIVVTLDSDGQHNPADIPRLLDALKDVDVVIGSRYAGRFYTFPRNVIGNFGLNFLINIFSYGPPGLLKHRWLGDTQSGLRAFRADALRNMRLNARRYEIESELVFETARLKLRVREIPIVTKARIKGVTIKDGINNGLFIFKKRFNL